MSDPPQLQTALPCKLAGYDIVVAVEDARHEVVIPTAPRTDPSAETADGR